MRVRCLLLLTLAGCAPAARTPVSSAQQPPAATGGGQYFLSSGVTKPRSVTIPAAADKVWPAALEAYRWVGLSVDAVDTAKAVVETRNMRVVGMMGRYRASDLFDCGSNVMGLLADRFTLTVNAQLAVAHATADGDTLSSTVATVFTAQGRDSQSGAATCTSQGKLEKLLEGRIRETLGLRPRSK